MLAERLAFTRYMQSATPRENQHYSPIFTCLQSAAVSPHRMKGLRI